MNNIEPSYLTPNQTKLLKEKGCPASILINTPEQWAAIKWIKNNYGLWIYVKIGYGFEYVIQEVCAPCREVHNEGTFKSEEEAYTAGIDYALNMI